MRKQSVWFNPAVARGTLYPLVNNSYDLGKADKAFRTAYIGTSIVGTATAFLISTNTTDASDTKAITLTGGGAAGSSRGGAVEVYGNENANTGKVILRAGNVSGGTIDLATGGATRWQVDISGNLVQDATNGLDIVFNNSLAVIRQGTTDGSDNKVVVVAGGGAQGHTRGAYLQVFGNEYGSSLSGWHRVLTGSASGASIELAINSSTGFLVLSGPTDFQAVRETVDGSDNKTFLVTGGGGASTTRGSYLLSYGNESAGTGALVLAGGAVSGGNLLFRLSHSSANIQVQNSSNNPMWIFAHDGTFVQGTTGASDIVGQVTNFTIRHVNNTSNLILAGGSSAAHGSGTYITLGGGSSANATVMGSTTGSVRLGTGGVIRWAVNSSGELGQDATSGSDLVFNLATGLIRQGTTDGSDNKEIVIHGGGANSRSRGGSISIRGNEHASYPGILSILSGNPGSISLDAISDIDFNSNGTLNWKLSSNGKWTGLATNTAGGTTGAQTINKPTGTVNFAAAATSLVVTNSLCSTSSIVFAVIRTNDTTAVIKNVVPGAGSFTINLNAAATAETSVGFWVIN
jgi:hypothetical protein